MLRNDVITRLKQAEPALRAFGVEALYLFGPHARDEADSESNIDLFVDPASGQDFGFQSFMQVYQTLQTAFACKIGIEYSTRAQLAPDIRENAEREAVRVF
jgi:predicted nucleotidyltransferase